MGAQKTRTKKRARSEEDERESKEIKPIDIGEAVAELMDKKGISEELSLGIIEDTLLAAYKKKFHNADNAVVRFDDDNHLVSMFAKKRIVDGVYDPAVEIELEEARELNPDGEIDDEILIKIDPRTFERPSVQNAKQTVQQTVRDIQKHTLYSEFKDKEGEVIIGYYQREKNGTIFVTLGKLEGILPKKFQSPRELYHVNDRIKALIVEVSETNSGCQVVLSRTHTDFVKKIFELEVPEIYEKTVEIHKIVREAGYRTKLAVYSNREQVDPVGACVGLKGVRIQAVIRELEGEKIDILKYDPDPKRFIKNALSPAEVLDVVIKDEAKRQAYAIVSDSQLSLAIGKQGINVKLANRLVDWEIDVKTAAQYEEMDLSSEARDAVSKLFGDEEEISRIAELPGVDEVAARILADNGIEFFEDFLNCEKDAISALLTEEQAAGIQRLIDEYVEIVEEEEEEEAGKEESAEEEAETEEFECPECGAKITMDMKTCPACGVGLDFEFEDE